MDPKLDPECDRGEKAVMTKMNYAGTPTLLDLLDWMPPL